MATHLTRQGAFDPSQVKLILGGYSPLGFTESKITVSKTEDVILPYVGSDNDLSLAINRNTLGTLTIGLQHTSPSNDVLAGWVVQGRGTRFVTFPVIMQDPSGMELLSTDGWIQSQPDYEVGKEIGELKWVIGLWDATLTGSTAVSILNSIISAVS